MTSPYSLPQTQSTVDFKIPPEKAQLEKLWLWQNNAEPSENHDHQNQPKKRRFIPKFFRSNRSNPQKASSSSSRLFPRFSRSKRSKAQKVSASSSHAHSGKLFWDRGLSVLPSELTPEKRQERINKFADSLIAAAGQPDEHLKLLEDLVLAHLNPAPGKDSTTVNEEFRNSTIDLATVQMSRLLENPQLIDHQILGSKLNVTFNRSQFSAPYFGSNSPGYDRDWWHLLKVVQCRNTVTRLLALRLWSNEGSIELVQNVQLFVNALSEVLDSIYKKGVMKKKDSSQAFIALSFAWATWQGCVNLLLSYNFDHQVRYGYDDTWNMTSVLRGNFIMNYVKVRQQPNYMCTWALRSVRARPSVIGIDFQQWFAAFQTAAGPRTARCKVPPGVCDGLRPQDCGRFYASPADRDKLYIKNQETHDTSCKNHTECESNRITWSRDSYMTVKGARAVSLLPKAQFLEYCPATNKTMAVSHVWSHGQGGRPNTGINRCLHERYVKIAKDQGCDSYWIDTTCIPDEFELRKEAIGYIKTIFSESKLTLIVDRDLVSHSARLTPNNLEEIMALLLVSDWNVRAWTLLEGLRGNKSLYILCKESQSQPAEKSATSAASPSPSISATSPTSPSLRTSVPVVVDLREALAKLTRSGLMSLELSYLAAQHLLRPSHKDVDDMSNFKTIEEAGSLLSHRHATRPGDTFVIWQLMHEENNEDMGLIVDAQQLKPNEADINATLRAAEAFWTSKLRRGRDLTTGFLMSTIPRLSASKLTWAPASPYVYFEMPNTSQGQRPYYSYNGHGSRKGKFQVDGISAEWLVHDITTQTGSAGTRRCLDLAKAQNLKGQVRLLVPCQNSHVERWQQTLKLEEDRGVMVVVCSANGGSWKWGGLCEWPLEEELPEFRLEKILLS